MKILPAIVIVFMLLMAFVTNGVIAQSPTPEPTVLGPGDVAIIGFNFDNPDEFAFVLLKDINPNTKIIFTDFGYSNVTHKFLTTDGGSEGYIEWVDLTKSLSKGEIIKIIPNSTDTNFSLHENGDQIFVFQGSTITPYLIFGINSQGGFWITDSETPLNQYNSHLPDSLNPTNSIAIPHIDNAIFAGGNSFTSPSAALAEIVKTSNWTRSDSPRLTMPSSNFIFTPTNIFLDQYKESRPILPRIFFGIIFLIPTVIALIIYFKKN
jgi:hypothetical protein